MTRRDSAFLLALLFLSGASALIFEILWIRGLGLWFGTTTPAITTVLAAFMAGLALGNVLLGRRADRHPRPLTLYWKLEAGIGISGLLVTLLILKGGPLLLAMARAASGSGALEPALRFAFVFALMLVPTTLMGGTVPVVARALARAGTEGRAVGWIYAANTAGAVAGVLLPDLLLIPSIGMIQAALAATAGNLLAAALASRLRASPKDVPEESRPFSLPRPEALLLFGVSGFCAMGYELIWSRVVQHLSGGRITGFALLLAVYLLFLSLGSSLSSTVADRVRRPLVWAAGLLCGTALAVLVMIAALNQGIELAYGLFPQEPGLLRRAWGAELGEVAVESIFLAALPCLLMGAAFPFLAAGSVRADRVGQETGSLVAVNTLAGVAGAAFTGFVLLPSLGSQSALQLLVLIAGLSGLGVTLFLCRDRIRLAAPAAGLVVGALALGFALPPDFLSRVYFARLQGRVVERVIEGPTTTAASATVFMAGVPYERVLLTPGVDMSSTGYGSRRYMSFMAHLPLFLTDGAENALLICYGVGNTARAILSHPDTGRLDVVDISSEVLALNEDFAPFGGGDPFADPRTRVIVDDGRHHLLTTDLRYDVITSEPPPPNDAGVVNLYSREFYRAAKRALSDKGVIAQWMPVFQMSREDILDATAAMTAEFPHTALFYSHVYQWTLVGSMQPLVIDPERWRTRGAEEAVRANFELSGLASWQDLAGSFMQSDTRLRELTEGVAPLSDIRPTIQYPLRKLYAPPETVPGIIGDPFGYRILLPQGPATPERRRAEAEIDRHAEVTRRLLELLPMGFIPEPTAWELLYGNAVRAAGETAPERLDRRHLLRIDPDRTAAARRALSESPGHPIARFYLAREAFYRSDWAPALEHLDRLTPEARREVGIPEPAWLLLRGGALRGLGRIEEAARDLRRAGAGIRDPRAREAVDALLEVLDRPFPAAAGPLSPKVVSSDAP